MRPSDNLRSEPTPRVTAAPEVIANRSTEAFATLCEKFARHGKPVNFDFRDHCLSWTSRGDHYTHRLHRYPARLTPYIPIFFLGVRGIAVSQGSLLDPFAGCGTVLVEASVHPCHPMRPVGFEINPLARLIAKVKTTPLEKHSVREAWTRLLCRFRDDRSRAGLPNFPNKRHWFTESVERGLARALRAINGVRDEDLKDFFLVALSSVVRQVALADPSVSVPVLIDPSHYLNKQLRMKARAQLESRKHADVLSVLECVVRNNLSRLLAWAAAAPKASRRAIVGADARNLRIAAYRGAGLLAPATARTVSGVDLVLTSPPYANAQRYTRALRLEQFVLGFTSDGAEERKLDELQVGTERVRHCDWKRFTQPTNVPAADTVIATVRSKDPYRAAIVGHYVRDMKTVVENCFAALSPGGHAIFVIGNNSIRGRLLDNAAILSQLGIGAGFRELLRVKNLIPSRCLITKRHHTAGVITHEHVVVLRKPKTARQGS